MSGGKHDYQYRNMQLLADTIGENLYGYDQDEIPLDIALSMREIELKLRGLARACHDLEWFISGDYGDDTLREQMEKWPTWIKIIREER